MDTVIFKNSFLYLIIFSFFFSQSTLGETQFTIEGDLDSLLYTAVKDGKNLLNVGILIENGADVNAKNDQGYTALHAAARYSTAAIVKALLEAGADVNAKSYQGYTPLYEVAHNKKEKDAKEIARVLLEAGKAGEIMNVRSYYGSTPFHWAARYGILALVETLIEAGVDVSAKDLKGYTPLHLAAEGNTEAIVEAILKTNVSVNAKADNGQTPLHLAAASNARTAVLKVLLEAEADINTKDKNHQTPLHLAAASNTNTEVLKILFAASKTSRDAKDVEGYTPFYRAVADNMSAAVIEFFILNGASAKAIIKEGWTALHVAARHNKEPDIMRTLIRAGANVNAKAQGGWTALHIAARYNTVSVVETLIQSGADVNVRGNFVDISKKDWKDRTIYPPGTQGLTPLHWAAENNTTTAPDIVEVLIKAGADVNAETKEEEGKNPRTPLALVVCYNTKTFLDVVEALLEAGAKVNELIRYCIGISNLKKEFKQKIKQVVLELGDWERLRQASIQSRMDTIQILERDGLNDLAAELRAELKVEMDMQPIPIRKEWASFSWPDVEEKFRGEVVEYLIYEGWTSSRWARQYTVERRLAILKVFLQYVDKISVSLSSGDITDILHVAVRDDETTGDFVKFLIQKGADVNSKNKDGQTSLHVAARYNTVDVVRILLEAGADMNAENKYGFVPLVSAIGNKEAAEAIVKMFIEKGMNVNATCTSTKDALKGYANLDLSSYYEFFLPDQFTILHIAVGYSTEVVVQALLKAGANVNARDIDGKTPLHWATHNTTDVVRALLKAEADVNIKDNNRRTPLHLVAAGRWEKMYDKSTTYSIPLKDAVRIVEALLEEEADVHARDTDGQTPLHLAAGFSNEVLRLLLEAGANVNTKGGVYEETPLHVAAYHNKLDIVKTLLKAGADVHARDKGGWLPLHSAINFFCEKSVVLELIQYGADMDEVVKKERGRKNESPRKQAKRLGCSWAETIK